MSYGMELWNEHLVCSTDHIYMVSSCSSSNKELDHLCLDHHDLQLTIKRDNFIPFNYVPSGKLIQGNKNVPKRIH